MSPSSVAEVAQGAGIPPSTPHSSEKGDEVSVQFPPSSMASFPRNNFSYPSPLKLEVEETDEGMNNPRNMWQVYALGGFMILRWVWARWRERKDNGKPSED